MQSYLITNMPARLTTKTGRPSVAKLQRLEQRLRSSYPSAFPCVSVTRHGDLMVAASQRVFYGATAEADLQAAVTEALRGL